jgi:hypothetical protein
MSHPMQKHVTIIAFILLAFSQAQANERAKILEVDTIGRRAVKNYDLSYKSISIPPSPKTVDVDLEKTEKPLPPSEPESAPRNVPHLAIGGLYGVALLPHLGHTSNGSQDWGVELSTFMSRQQTKALTGRTIYWSEGWTLHQGLAVNYYRDQFAFKVETSYQQHNEDMALAEGSTTLSHLESNSLGSGLGDFIFTASYQPKPKLAPAVGISVSAPTGSESKLLGTGSSSQAFHLTWVHSDFQTMVGWVNQSDLKTSLGKLNLQSNFFVHLAYSMQETEGWVPSFSLYLAQNPFRDELDGEDAESTLIQLGLSLSKKSEFLAMQPQLTIGLEGESLSYGLGMNLAF